MTLQIDTSPTDPGLTNAQVGTPFDFTVAASGGTGSLAWDDDASEPDITGFTASGGVPMSGGAVALSATADNDVTSFTFSFVGGPTSISGFPITVAASGGGASTGSISFPANNTNAAHVYTFRVQATGPGGNSATADLVVVVPPTPQLVISAGESASGEWWDRDAAQSTPDNQVWVYGDTSVFTKAAGPSRGTHLRDDFGSTSDTGGAEHNGTGGVPPGHYTQLPASATTIPGIRFWPKGICYFRPEGGTPLTSDALVTFARVNYTGGGGFTVLGWGYVWRSNVYTNEYNTGQDFSVAPRVAGGVVYGHRINFATNPWTVMERALDLRVVPGAVEATCNQPAAAESNCTFDPNNGLFYCAATNNDGTWQLYSSPDYITWTFVNQGATSASMRNPYPHVTPFGILVTWYDNIVHHTVGVLAA